MRRTGRLGIHAAAISHPPFAQRKPYTDRDGHAGGPFAITHVYTNDDSIIDANVYSKSGFPRPR